jgi:OOP family OmpA-OmpF porin
MSVAQKTLYTKTPAVGVHLACIDLNGANDLSSFGRQMQPGIALNFQNSFSQKFGYSISLTGSFIQFSDGKGSSLGNGKKHLLLENDFSVKMRFLKSPALFNPFVLAGFGWSQYNDHYGLYAPLGLGLQVNVTPYIYLLLNSQYRIPVTSLQQQHFFQSIGIAGAINRKKIVHTMQIQLPLPVVQKASSDMDGDGIIDSLDACPQVPGVVRYHGCPVPDRDSDGIFDEDDSCPDVKGVVEYKGCPMPDKDRDGIADPLDKCPDMAGSAVNGGCPEIATLLKMINWAAENIFFETGSHRLLPKSFNALDSVANLLKKYPMLQLTIEGHTDNLGGVKSNQALSEKRANAVMVFLIKADVADVRLKGKGFGEQQPIAVNSTPEGQAANRRVVFKLNY